MKFEVGKYYRHTTGQKLHVLGELETTMWGKTLIGESDWRSELIPVGQTDDNAVNWSEIDREEWMKSFS